MLLGNDILTRGIALFRRDFSSALERLLLPPSSANRRLAEKAYAFLYETTFYSQATQNGEVKFGDADFSLKEARLLSLFYLYLTVENFLLNSIASEAARENQMNLGSVPKDCQT